MRREINSKKIGTLASEEELKPLQDALNYESPPLCRGTMAVSAEDLTFFSSLAKKGRPDICRLINLSRSSETDLADLTQACDAATFGRAQTDVLDESYRKAGKLDTINFATSFDPIRFGLANVIRSDLLEGITESRPIRLELYKLNVYGERSFFKPHKDTPRSENMFGSLVITFPTAYTGGELVLREGGKEWTFDPASSLQSAAEPTIGYVAFFSDVEHEVLPVTSGCRVTTTYNLYFEDLEPTSPRYQSATVNLTSDSEAHIKNTLQQMLDNPKFLSEGGSLGFGLRRLYPVKSDENVQALIKCLKGNDAVILRVCEELGLSCRLAMFYEDADQEEASFLLNKVPSRLGYGLQVEDFSGMMSELGVVISAGYCEMEVEEQVSWVVPPLDINRRETAYVAYGNEASLGYVYFDLVMIAVVGGVVDTSPSEDANQVKNVRWRLRLRKLSSVT